MAIIKVAGVECNVPIREEIGQYPFNNTKWSQEKLIASSPFRPDQAPSFFVNFDTGGWADSGAAHDEEWGSGNFAKLLSFLRGETYEQTIDYLQSVYSIHDLDEGSLITLPPVEVRGVSQVKYIPELVLQNFTRDSTYLNGRGISDRIQEVYGIYHDPKHNAVVFPWRHPVNGRIVNMKYRRVDEKTFWYEKGATPINTLLFGMDIVYGYDKKVAYVTEAEVDALSAYELYGEVGIALGTASVSDRQLDLIRKSPIETLVVATDNDKAGKKVAAHLIESLQQDLEVLYQGFDSDVKDLNDLLLKFY